VCGGVVEEYLVDLGGPLDTVDERPDGGNEVGVVGDDHGLVGEGGTVRGVRGADDRPPVGGDDIGVQVRRRQDPDPRLDVVASAIGEVTCARTAAREAFTTRRSPARSGSRAGASSPR
jgi:hypothetical protein